jgi:hypothetical protein
MLILPGSALRWSSPRRTRPINPGPIEITPLTTRPVREV